MLFLFGIVIFHCFVFGQGSTTQDAFKNWDSYKIKFNKTYKSPEEETFRSMIYLENLEKIRQHNEEFMEGHRSYQLRINQFSDMLNSEWVARRPTKSFTGPNTAKGSAYLRKAHIQVDEEVNWVTEGAVADVRDQGWCESAWAFSAVGSLEGQQFRSSGLLVPLSEQHLVDCLRPEHSGCSGGDVNEAFDYIFKSGGIDTLESYPYQAQYQYYCAAQDGKIGATITGYTDLPEGDEDALKEAVATIGPISAYIDASQDSFRSFGGGIYDEPNCDCYELDHQVVIVGYGTEQGMDYWLVKNSWGKDWGEDGYVKMARNKDNQCGIATAASFPLM